MKLNGIEIKILDNKNIKILEAIYKFNKENHIKACYKDTERETGFSYNTVRMRLKDLESENYVLIENNRRVKEIQLTEKGEKVVFGSQTFIEDYRKT